jgi:membrane-associated phospholipid phosphatase
MKGTGDMLKIVDRASSNELCDTAKSSRFVRVFVVVATLFVMAIIVAQFEPQIVPSRNSLPKFITTPLNRIEVFGHGVGAILIITSAAIVSHSPLRTAWLLGAPALFSGLAADFVKLFVGRYRPYAIEASASSSGVQFLNLADPMRSFIEHATRHEMHSFPSAHTAVAFGLASGLSAIAPRGRLLFFCLAILVGFQRVAAGSHFPSDVLVGAGIGLLVGAILIRASLGDESATTIETPAEPAVVGVPHRKAA